MRIYETKTKCIYFYNKRIIEEERKSAAAISKERNYKYNTSKQLMKILKILLMKKENNFYTKLLSSKTKTVVKLEQDRR